MRVQTGQASRLPVCMYFDNLAHLPVPGELSSSDMGPALALLEPDQLQLKAPAAGPPNLHQGSRDRPVEHSSMNEVALPIKNTSPHCFRMVRLLWQMNITLAQV